MGQAAVLGEATVLEVVCNGVPNGFIRTPDWGPMAWTVDNKGGCRHVCLGFKGLT